MLFYRGISVPKARAEEIIREIRTNGIKTQAGTWKNTHYKPDLTLIDRVDLRQEHTKPKGLGTPVLYACGNKAGAHYYATRHNLTQENDTPVVVHFESHILHVAVDGKDFLYPALQTGDPDRARPISKEIFGSKGLSYAEKAWKEASPDGKIAIGDLMIHDPEVMNWHHSSNIPIRGRSNTEFTNAFTVALPIPASAIINVAILNEVESFSGQFVGLHDLRKR